MEVNSVVSIRCTTFHSLGLEGPNYTHMSLAYTVHAVSSNYLC